MQVMKAILIGIIVLIGVSVTNCCFNRASNEAKTDSRPKGTPEKFIVSRGGTGNPQASKQFETFYHGDGCSYFPHSWRNSIDAFYTNSDKDCIEICAEDWCQGCAKVPHVLKKGDEARVSLARAELGKIAKTYRNCKV